MALTREQILGAVAKTAAVQVPDLGEVLIRPLSVASLNKFLASREALQGAEVFVQLIVLSACDEAGARLFSDDDFEAVSGLGLGAVKLLGEEILGLNGMAQGQDDDAVKNSSPGPSGDTSSS